MNSGNQLLSIAAIFILQLLILTANKHNIERTLIKNTNKAVLAASSVAQSIIEEIHNKAFDESTVLQSVSDDNDLTDVSYLGTDTGELINTQFDDIDDYNGYVTEIDLEDIGKFQVSVQVNYRINMDTEQVSSTQTFVKAVTVTVDNFSLANPIKYSQVIAY